VLCGLECSDELDFCPGECGHESGNSNRFAAGYHLVRCSPLDRAPGALAVHGDHSPREPCPAQPDRNEGRWAPGVVCVDGVDHDLTVVRVPAGGRPGVGQATRLASTHAINYLLAGLDESYLAKLRAFDGLQSYPSRIKDPDLVDYSTGSVGIGATAPIWGAMARRYLDSRFPGNESPGRQYSLLGDAELDEGAVWEAIVDPGVAEQGEIVWVVDVNRQSLDRVVPLIATDRLRGMFTAAGWQVISLKYGRLLEAMFTQPGGDVLRHRTPCPTPSTSGCSAAIPANCASGSAPAIRLSAGSSPNWTTRPSPWPIRNLGGHDFSSLGEAFAAIDNERPTLILAYTIKGYGLPIEGHPQNHSALLTAEQISQLAAELGADPERPWRRWPADTQAARLCAEGAERLARPEVLGHVPPDVPKDLGRTPAGTATTQAALGRTLLDLTREAPEAAARVVTVSPDVSSSTNLGGWVNKVGVWSARERTDWFADDAETILHWREKPTGQHIELRHRRDQPGRLDRGARRDLEPVGPAAAAGRGALRPVRGAGAGAVVIRDLRRRPVNPGRHPVRRHFGP
jgi:transketolase N-terminal domain/subunit